MGDTIIIAFSTQNQTLYLQVKYIMESLDLHSIIHRKKKSLHVISNTSYTK